MNGLKYIVNEQAETYNKQTKIDDEQTDIARVNQNKTNRQNMNKTDNEQTEKYICILSSLVGRQIVKKLRFIKGEAAMNGFKCIDNEQMDVDGQIDRIRIR